MTLTRTRVIVGAAITGLVVLTLALLVESLSGTSNAQIVGYQPTGDARRIVVIVGVGLADDIADRKVDEDERTIRVTVRKHTNPGSYPAILIYLPVTVGLRSALGDRAVVDQSGASIRDLGQYQLPGQPTPPP